MYGLPCCGLGSRKHCSRLPACLLRAKLVNGWLFTTPSLSPIQRVSVAEQTAAGQCRGGISHSPQEHVAPDDVAAATAALYRYLQREALRPAS